MIKNPFCRPRMRTAAAARKTAAFSPMSLLDRLREAVFRLIMISALSKGSNAGAPRSSPAPDRHYHPNDDPYHSEAVADCIEFIKKSATASDEHRRSAGGDAALQVVIPLPVM